MSAGVSRSTFQAFSWLRDDLREDRAAIFAVRMKDLGFGVHKCLQLIEASELDRAHGGEDGEDGDAPLLSLYDTSVLLRLALATAEIIGEQAQDFLTLAQARCDQAKRSDMSAAGGGGDHE